MPGILIASERPKQLEAGKAGSFFGFEQEPDTATKEKAAESD
jgi:hypothetical protein